MTKHILLLSIIGWLFKLIIFESLALGLVWLINTIFTISVGYTIVGSVVFIVMFLGLIYSLLVLNTSKSVFNKIEKEFDKW